MFTGIVEEVGMIRSTESRAGTGGADRRITIACSTALRERLTPGASVSVAGVCLTVVGLSAATFDADVSGETLGLTTLGGMEAGARVNLEPALRAGDSLGGHWVSGHVDGAATIVGLAEDARSTRVELTVPHDLARYVARKGSVTLDGVSLTVNDVSGARFGVNLVPHTKTVTTLGSLAVGQLLNLEIDILARYVERLTTAGASGGVEL